MRPASSLLLVLLLSFISVPRPAMDTQKVSPRILSSSWERVVHQSIARVRTNTPLPSRAFAVVHTCIYDVWAAYDNDAVGTQLSQALRRPPAERAEPNKDKAISYAAYRALSDLYPSDAESVFKPLMRQLGYDPNDSSADIETPQGIGNIACAAVLEFRHHDNANSLGDITPAGKQDPTSKTKLVSQYADWTGYTPINSPGTLPARATFSKPLNPDHWQPLTYTDSSGNLVVQMFAAAHWSRVTPFALSAGDELRSFLDPLPAKYGSPEYQHQAEELVALSAGLTDRQKMLAEFWTSQTDLPSARWLQFAEFVAERDHLSFDDQVKLFFVLSSAMMDADIAAYDAKRYYDSVRPATAIPLLFRGKRIKMWGGPGKGTIEADGGQWLPYQPATLPTPPSPEYVSEIGAESAAAAEILRLFTGSDKFGFSGTIEKGSSQIEPGLTPFQPVTLKWQTFTDAVNDVGMATRYAGIQFAPGDLAGRKLGHLAAAHAWAKAQSYFAGHCP